nr:unnamed protein product [Callosobruchus analis]
MKFWIIIRALSNNSNYYRKTRIIDVTILFLVIATDFLSLRINIILRSYRILSIVFLLVFLTLHSPYCLGDPDFTAANPLVTPAHIKTE